MGAEEVDITEVRIKLMEESEDRLRAFCSITFDACFVVRDLKIIEGSQGPFVAMPSRKLTNRCSRCGNKNAIRSNFCNNCGTRIREQRESRDEDAPNKLYADVAHPINQACRDMIQQHVVAEYLLELERAKLPGYVSRYDDSYDAGELGDYHHLKGPSDLSGQSPVTSVQPPHFQSRDQHNRNASTSGNESSRKLDKPQG
jgi:stage V sporulation protein G